MKHAKFKTLVAENEELFKRKPEACRRRLELFLLLGKAYYVFALIVPAFLIAFLIWSYASVSHHGRFPAGLVVILACMEFVLIKILLLKWPLPEGTKLDPKEFPALFAEIESVRALVNAPKPDKVLIDGSFNAGVAQLPGRFSFLPGPFVLILGLPLMASISKGEFRSLLGHELGHLSLSHPAYLRRASRTQNLWFALRSISGLENDVFNWLLLGIFARLYVPRLDAMMAVFSRANEFDADKKAAEVSNPAVAARALAIFSVRGELAEKGGLRDFWETAKASPEPAKGLYSVYVEEARKPLCEESFLSALSKAGMRKTLESDTHPSLKERVSSLGLALDASLFPHDGGADSAKEFFGAKEAALLKGLDEAWLKDALPLWRKAYEDANLARKSLADLEDGASTLELSLKRAMLLEASGSSDESLRILEELLPAHSDSSMKVNLGRMLLDRDDPRGASLVKEAIEADVSYLQAGVALLVAYYERAGLESERDALLDYYESSASRLKRDLKARGTLSRKQIFEPHTLSKSELEHLREILKKSGKVARAYVFKRKLDASDLGENVMVVSKRFPLLGITSTDDSALVDEIAKQASSSTSLLIFPFSRCPFIARWRMKRVQGSLIYQQP